MGEIADMMLDGTLCQECGCLMDYMEKGAIKNQDGTFTIVQEPKGYPCTCKDCKKERKSNG